MWNTVIITLFAATPTVLLAFAVSWLVVRPKSRGDMLWTAFCLHLTPCLESSWRSRSSFYISSRRFGPRPLRHGVDRLLALITQYIAFATRTTNAAITQIHKELEEAGEASGASQLRVLWQITFPLIRPAFIAAWLWVAAHAVRAFSVRVNARQQGQLALVGYALASLGRRANPAVSCRVGSSADLSADGFDFACAGCGSQRI